MFATLFSLTAAVVSVAMDLRTGKVRNWWICILWFVGMLYGMFQGWRGVGHFLMGSIFPMICLFPLFRFRMLGPGDIKLFSALGGVMGAESIGICIFVSFLCGGILSLGILLLYGELFSRLRHFADYIQISMNQRKILPYYTLGNQWENIHFTVPILMGVIMYAGGIY